MPRAARTIGLLVLIAACRPPAPAQEQVAEGLTVSGPAASLGSLLDQLATLEGTPIARQAGAAKGALEGCASFRVALPPGSGVEQLASAITCEDRTDESAALRLSFRSPAVGTFIASGSSDEAGAWAFEGTLAASDDLGPASMILPAERGPGPAVLNDRGALVHLRGRSDGGLDIATLVPEGSEADTMLGLRGSLLSSAVLDGTWEAAVYEVPAGSTLPPIVAAAGHRLRPAADRALDALARKFEDEHATTRTSIFIGGQEGLCLPALNVLPEFAPCAVVTDGAVVIAWNEAALRLALDPPPDGPPTAREPLLQADGSTSAITVDLAALPRSDRTLIEARGEALGGGGGPTGEPIEWPWSRLALTGRRDGPIHRFALVLSSAREPRP